MTLYTSTLFQVLTCPKTAELHYRAPRETPQGGFTLKKFKANFLRKERVLSQDSHSETKTSMHKTLIERYLNSRYQIRELIRLDF